MKSYSITDVGQKRKENQDFIFASDVPVGNLPNLYVVADGMGGHNAGDFASRCAVETLLASVMENQSSNPVIIIRTAVEAANIRLLQEASDHEELSGMGTTMVLLTVVGPFAYVANVGDSRLYLVDQHKITQITKDHSLVEEMIRMGELTKDEARVHPDKNIITRAVGVAKDVKVDFFDIHLSRNDILLLCSDGLSNMVTDECIYKTIRSGETLETIGDHLIDLANENGGKDNIAVILARPDAKEVEEC